MNDARVLVLFGGGLDSAVMSAFAHQQYQKAHLLFFDYGQKALVGETASLKYLSNRFDLPYTIVQVPREIVPPSPLTEGVAVKDLRQQAKNEVLGRNLLFLSLGFSFALTIPTVHTIWIGADVPVTGGGFNDQKQPTFDGFNLTTAFAYGERSPRIVAPLLSFRSKVDYLRRGLVLLPELFSCSFSCYESTTATECGECNHCLSKARARVLIEENMSVTTRPFVAQDLVP